MDILDDHHIEECGEVIQMWKGMSQLVLEPH